MRLKHFIRNHLFLFIFLLAVIIIAIFATLFHFRNKPESDRLVLYGNVDVRQVDISFRVAGQVVSLCYEEGDFVQQGTLLSILDKTPYDSQIKQAKATVAANQASLKVADILLERRQSLIGIGAVSQEDLDNALASRNEIKANLDAAKAALAIQMDNMEYTEIYAPTDGIILSRIREPGSVVNPGEPVYTLSVVSPVWIRAYVAEPELGSIYYGMPATIYTDSHTSYTGKVGFISPVAEFTPKTVQTTQLRTDLVYRLRIYADNPDRYLKQGMPVTVHLDKRVSQKRHAGY